jgi:hypothetical protein
MICIKLLNAMKIFLIEKNSGNCVRGSVLVPSIHDSTVNVRALIQFLYVIVIEFVLIKNKNICISFVRYV